MNGQIKVRSEKNQAKVYVSLGSNMGDRSKYLSLAKEQMLQAGLKMLKESSIYETEAWGKTDQNEFLNQIIMAECMMSPHELLSALLKIESALGREREEKYGPRTIDLDILFYNDQIIKDKDLVVPHPEIGRRKFILLPMIEIAPDFMHPLLKINMKHLSNDCTDTSKVTLYLS